MLKKETKAKLIKAVTAVIILLCIFLVLDIIFTFVKSRRIGASDLKITAGDIASKKAVSYQEYTQKLKNVFSGSGADKDVAGKKFELISLINGGNWSKIKLTGTILGGSVSMGVVEADGKNYAVYKGESLGDYRVKDVTKSSVVFEGNGEKKTIMLNYSGTGSSVTTQGSASSPSSNTVLSKEELNSLIEPPDRLAKEATFMPIQQDGLAGVKLAYLKPDSLLQKIGLMQNDVLLEVNGQSLQSGDDIFKAYQIFRNEDHIAIKVKRGSDDVNITLEVK
ncbi:MAG: hypothetical protein ABIH00_00445 [Armatimonadota bacterium]